MIEKQSEVMQGEYLMASCAPHRLLSRVFKHFTISCSIARSVSRLFVCRLRKQIVFQMTRFEILVLFGMPYMNYLDGR